MNLFGTKFTLSYESYEIYLSGCKRHCKGCHNPDSWDFNNGDILDDKLINKLINRINNNSSIKNIWIVGGEPLHQDINELSLLLSKLKETNKPIWLFTHYEYQEIPLTILNQIDYVKTGFYDETLKCDNNIHFGVKLDTSNQKIIKV